MKRLSVPFITKAPDIDESRLKNEPPKKYVLRMAQEKTRKISYRYPDAIVIGSDQTCVYQNKIFGKPITKTAAKAQLRFFSEKTVYFFAGLTVYAKQGKWFKTYFIPTKVRFKRLNPSIISTYVALDNPLACAGSMKSESMGILLCDEVESKDPTALIGLPLITLSRVLMQVGYPIFR